MGNHHGKDEAEEKTVVVSANATVQEKAVMVVVFDAGLTKLAVFGVIRLKQLPEKKKSHKSESDYTGKLGNE